jgi:hypothetical protein
VNISKGCLATPFLSEERRRRSNSERKISNGMRIKHKKYDLAPNGGISLLSEETFLTSLFFQYFPSLFFQYFLSHHYQTLISNFRIL